MSDDGRGLVHEAAADVPVLRVVTGVSNDALEAATFHTGIRSEGMKVYIFRAREGERAAGESGALVGERDSERAEVAGHKSGLPKKAANRELARFAVNAGTGDLVVGFANRLAIVLCRSSDTSNPRASASYFVDSIL